MNPRRALAYVFERPGWPSSMLYLAVALLVPLVGPVAVMGYQAVIAEHLVRNGDRNWPLFDFGRLADYLQRGLRVFLVSIVLSVVVTPVAMVVLFAGHATAFLLMNPESTVSMVLVGCVVIVEALVFLALIYGSIALATPLWLRAAFEPDLGAVFDVAFVRDFLARIWKPLLVSHVWVMLLSTGLVLAGMLACFVGMFPAIALTMLVQAYTYGHLYLVYLERGGRPIAAVGAGPVAAPPG
jgi:hypothetical protein